MVVAPCRYCRSTEGRLAASLEAWDAVTLLIDRAGSASSAPSADAYRFVAQLGSSPAHQAAYRGDGTGWTAIAIPYEAEATWRGGGPNSGDEAKGWQLIWEIPFSNLGLPGRPAVGTDECRLSSIARSEDALSQRRKVQATAE